MNELIILAIVSAICVGTFAIGTPIAYIEYRIHGGKNNFWNWLIHEF